MSTLGKLHSEAFDRIEVARTRNKAIADRCERMMNRAISQYYQNIMPEEGLRAILEGLAAGDATELNKHITDEQPITLPSQINQ